MRQSPDAFRDPFGFNHDEVGAGVEKALRLFDAPLWVPRTFRFQFFGLCCASGAELNTDLGFRFQTGLLHFLDKPQPVVGGNSDESARNFDNVEAHLPTFPYIVVDRLSSLCENVLQEPTC